MMNVKVEKSPSFIVTVPFYTRGQLKTKMKNGSETFKSGGGMVIISDYIAPKI